MKRAAGIVFKIALVLALTAAVMVGMLKVLETSGDPLRQGIERYLADATNSHAYLTELSDPAFFPDVRITMKGVALSDRADPEKKRASADSVTFSMPFLNILGGNKAVEDIRIENLAIEKGVITAEKIRLDFAGIDKDAAPPVLTARGTYGGRALSVTVDLTERQDGARRFYRLPPHTPYIMKLGSATLQGTVDSARDGVYLRDSVLSGIKGGNLGPQSFLLVKDGEFVNDNPVFCLLDHGDAKGGRAHPCARLFTEEKDAKESAQE